MRKLTFILFAMLINCAVATCYSQSIKFVMTDGTAGSYSLTSSSIITFQDDNLLYNQTVFTSAVDDIQKITFMTSSGIQNHSSDSRLLLISPNPAKETITFSTDISENCVVNVFSMTGSLVISTNMNPATELLCIASLQKGIYLVKIKNQTAKFIKL